MIPDNVIMNASGCGDIDELQNSVCDIIITKFVVKIKIRNLLEYLIKQRKK